MNIVDIASELSVAKLSGIGESTHGTHEFFDFKSKIFKELVNTHNYNVLLLEDSPPVCESINEYIISGKGNLNDLMKGLYSVWQVEELKSLILWLKENYKTNKATIAGFDINQVNEDLSRRDELMANNIRKFFIDNPKAKALIWAHNSHLQTKASNFNKKPMGLFLKKFFNKRYVAIAQLFGTGSVSATKLKMNAPPNSNRKLNVIRVDSIPPELAEATLDRLSTRPYYLNKIQLENINKEKLKLVRSIGWGLVPDMVNEITEETDISSSFDGLIYFPVAKHSKPLS